MADQRVKTVRTTVSEPEMAAHFMTAAKKLYNIDLTQKQVGLLIAQNNLETAHRNAMFNYNIGNITHSPGDGWDFFIHQDKNGNDMKLQEQVSPGKWVAQTMRFRSYPDLETATEDYLKNLHNRAGGKVWNTIMQGDPAAFSKSLKQSGYYTADEKGYTAGLTGSYDAFNKSDSFQRAQSGNFDKGQAVATTTPHEGAQPMDQINQYLNSFLSALSEDNVNDKLVKKATYKKFLPKNDIVIQVKSSNLIDSLEFARILCLALDEETQSDATIHTDKENVEVLCSIHGPEEICKQAVNQLSSSIAGAFKLATKKIGGVDVKTKVLSNKASNYQELDIDLAQLAYRQFHLKFIK